MTQANFSTKTLIEQSFDMDTLSVIEELEQRYVGDGPAEGAADLPQFWRVMHDLIEAKLAIEGRTEEMLFIESFPNDINKPFREVITFNVKQRLPGGTGKMGPFQGQQVSRRLKPEMVRRGIKDPDNPGYSIDVFMQPIDNWVTLTCWALTNNEADSRALWLEDLIIDFRSYILALGFDDMIWIGQEDNLEYTPYPNGSVFHGRPVDVYVRTQKVRAVSKKVLEEVLVKVAANV